FTINSIDENRDYKFYIEAFSNRGTKSMSIVNHKFTYMPPPPSYINLDYVTVLNDRMVEISFTPDLSGIINDFVVSKSGSESGNYSFLQYVLDLTKPTYTLTDSIVTQREQYFYKVEALNSCLAPIFSSNTANNILIKDVKVNGSIISFSWDPYIEFSTGIYEYRIHRKYELLEEGQLHEYEMIDYLDPSNLSFSEDISYSGNNTIKGELEYYVEAIEYGANPMEVTGVSKSNEIKVNVETKIYLPNAFTPNGDTHNDFFLPIFDFVPKVYRMIIYDRSGTVLFQSTDPSIGWDGSMNGSKKAPEGVYIYHIDYTSYNGRRLDTTNNVTLILP
ncbi:MAG: gliding motility-associated C-terminal domain-containing protein, partial [Bacteroidales bacterium]|nr:gliding motility-associated C-terminal domain-containing protein [Bacteroidales bacterium]